MKLHSRWRALALAAVAGLAFAVYLSMRLAYAEYLYTRGSREDVERAVRLAPYEPRYQKAWARLNPAGRTPALERVVELNPRDSAAWVELGLLAEADNDLARAERCLLEAARIDRTFASRWALANYYFRHGAGPEFWRWMRESAAMAPADLTPLFELCWKASTDPNRILAALPNRSRVLASYLSFLLAGKRLDAGQPVAERLLATAPREFASVLLNYCDRLIDAGQADLALRTWNSLIARGVVSTTPLDPPRGLIVTDGRFEAPPLEGGFAWRIPSNNGVEPARTAPGLRFTFSGKQPENCELLSQYLPVGAGRYRVEFQYRTSGFVRQSGARWRIGDAASAPLSSETRTWESFEFETRPGLARLILSYGRMPGTVRIEGTLWLSEVRVERISRGAGPEGRPTSKL